MAAFSPPATEVLPKALARAAARGGAPAKPSTRPRLQVLLAAPYAPRGGGMGRIMAYVAGCPDEQQPFSFTMLETRGAGSGPASVLHAGAACARILAARLRGPTLLHVNVAGGISIFRKGMLIVTARALGVPVLLHLHAADLEDYYAQLTWPADALVRRLFAMAQKVAILGSPWLGFVTQNLGVAPERVVCLPNGVPDCALPTQALPNTGRPLCLAFVGNLLPRKGIADLLQALALPGLAELDFRLKIAGGGETRLLAAMADDLCIADRIEWQGWLERADITRLFASADIVVLPSYHEALPLVLLEAACQSRAIVTTRAGAIGDYFSHGQDALLVAAGDVAALHRAIARLAEDRGLRLRLGRNARALYERSFTMPRMMEKLAQIYRDCAHGAEAAEAPGLLPHAH